MKATGIVRKVDELGRIVLPIELRRTLDIEEKDPIEIYVDEDKIILKKYHGKDACIFCKTVEDDIYKMAGKHPICKECLGTIRKKALEKAKLLMKEEKAR